MPMDWDKLRIFHTVAEAGSLTKAANKLFITQSSVSRHISALEEEIGTMVFHRHPRGLLLTDQGERLYRTVHEMALKFEDTRTALTETMARPQGDIKVTATFSFGSTWLTPRLSKFMSDNPDIRINLILADQELDLGMRKADIAIRLREPVQMDLIRKKLFTVHLHIYASKTYLEQRGTPQTLADLNHHNVLSFDAPANLKELDWLTTAGRDNKKPRTPYMSVNSIVGLKAAVENDLGIALLPDYIIDKNSALVRVLPNVETPTLDAFIVYPEELRYVARIEAFRDFLVKEASLWSY